MIELVYPTIERRVTQAYMARPGYYARFGLAGNDGIDLAAPEGSPILAVMAGSVTRVGWKVPGHPYGYAVRTETRAGNHIYEWVYAHLIDGSSPLRVGDVILAGALIGYCGRTGNSQGFHLHASLKCKGATLENRTRQPNDLIDPTILIDLAVFDPNRFKGLKP